MSVLFEKAIKGFLASGYLNQWLKDAKSTLYVRKGKRFVRNNETLIDALEIANINIASKERGKGKFTELVTFCEQINPYPLLFVENVLDERFQSWFVRNGWSQYEIMLDPPSYYKITGTVESHEDSDKV